MDTTDRDSKTATPPAQQPPAKTETLRAKPVRGEVDHTALTREFIKRFPKLRAALAK